MCELFAISSKHPTRVTFSLKEFSRHGGETGPHTDGWGVAYYNQSDVLLLREPEPASQSPLVQFMEENSPSSGLIISHIRRATHGQSALRNTHPFTRELNGQVHTFAHNGELENIQTVYESTFKSFQPIGETDSERAFCHLLELMSKLWKKDSSSAPKLEERLEVFSKFAEKMRTLGSANFLYSDSEYLYIHSHKRTQRNGKMEPPGLHLLQRDSTTDSHENKLSGVCMLPKKQKIVLAASVPLTDEIWCPLAEGEIVVMYEGNIIRRIT